MNPAASHASAGAEPEGLLARLNSKWHERALQIFGVIVLAHWAEHLAQAIQVYGLGRKPPQALGVLGTFFPWLIKSELLHYGYAIIMLIGLWILRSGFVGVADRRWWTISLVIQFWHHIEHGILQAQAILGFNFFGRPVPTSIAQLWFPRLELHLFYNTIVFIPMALGMYFHMFPREQAVDPRCSCAWHPRPLAAPTANLA